jgi:hypothetical protein
MLGVEIELELEDAPSIESDDPPSPPNPGTDLLVALTDWWAHTVAEPYTNLSSDHKLAPLTIDWSFLEERVSFEVRFDLNLLADVFEAYVAFGWDAVEKIARKLQPLPHAKAPTKEFFRITCNVVAVMVAHGLVQVEAQAIIYAQKKWESSRSVLIDYLSQFKVVKHRVEHHSLKDRKLAAELFDLFREYSVEARKAQRLQREIETRNRKDPPATRVQGSGAALWFEVFAVPHREALNKMAGLLKRIAAKFPAAVLVLDDELPDIVLNPSSDDQRVLASMEVETRLYSTLQYMLGELEALEKSLAKPGATATLVEVLAPFLAERRDFGLLTRMRVPAGGFEQSTLNAVLDRTEKDDQRLFANLDLLQSFHDEDDGVARGTWEQVVLYRYKERLTAAIDEKRESDEFWAAFWRGLAKVAALLALLALMVVFPFGEVAAGPALASFLALCASGAAILGVMTMVHDLLSGLEQAGRLEVEARDKLFRLAQVNPDAVLEVGRLLSRSKALREAVAKGLVLTIVTLGAARKLRIVAAALNWHGFASDVETLFEPEVSPAG